MTSNSDAPQKHFKRLRLVLGDQLNARHSWYSEKDDQTLYLIAELKQECSYVKHHAQKICAFFIAMAHFSKALSNAGHEVLYLSLDDSSAYENLPELIQSLMKRFECSVFEYQRPDEYRLLAQLRELKLHSGQASKEYDTEHFLLPYDDIPNYFKEGRHVRMESFYRKMRKRFDILMQGDQPAGERWNFDADNRNKLSKEAIEDIPQPLVFSHPSKEVEARLKRHNVISFGNLPEELPWPCTRQEALSLLSFFCQHCLLHFGRYQDAMTSQTPHAWSLYHSRLSFALNTKMISPKQVIDAVLEHYAAHPELELAQVEGFVRQILGWREYVRGMYWSNMPSYAEHNYFEASRPLPEWFWSGETNMHCLQQSIQQSLVYAYAHHIQRLMVIGNFAMLAGLDPDAVDQWYLGIYIDAIEWVELPNTRGMSQFADGGMIATKPYAASGNYIQKMSDYCLECDYSTKHKLEDNACPLNSLYWDFLYRHQDKLGNNPRLSFAYRNLDKMTDSQREALLAKARQILENLDQL